MSYAFSASIPEELLRRSNYPVYDTDEYVPQKQSRILHGCFPESTESQEHVIAYHVNKHGYLSPGELSLRVHREKGLPT